MAKVYFGVGIAVVGLMVAVAQWLGGSGTGRASLVSSRVVSGVKKNASAEIAGTKDVSGRVDRGVSITSEDRAKLKSLERILESKNDNDPSLDRDFNGLSLGAKELMRSRYGAYAAEKRNERGTIVFLLGRNLTAEEDFVFLGGVLNETPCRSLANCARDASSAASSEELHYEVGTETTLAYPQLVALKSIENFLAASQSDSKLERAALAQIESARSSKIGSVADEAARLYERFASRR